MSLFDKVISKEPLPENQSLSEQESFLGITLAMAAVDGHIAQAEAQTLLSYVRRMRRFKNFRDDQLIDMFDKIISLIRRHGVDEVLQKAKRGLSEEMRETAFACAIDVAFADGVIDDKEKQLIDDLQLFLEIPGNTALKIIQVMIIKNRG